RDHASAACGRADRGGTGTSPLPAALAFGPADSPAGTADLPAAEQRPRAGAVVGPDFRRGPLVAASPGPSRGGPPGEARPLLHPAPAGTGPAALGQRDNLCAATAAVQGVTSKCWHLSWSRVSRDFQVLALTRLCHTSVSSPSAPSERYRSSSLPWEHSPLWH